ncbi:VOC family protein [Neobacillus piezotolerans]|uniref:VOC family protein n=1 Tax=Neobacillus piezotolerans TaxID=2259171 RepID=A0A3D8GTT3_9BACI|nr:VOC family protein [Neobacillus piezotolerans]RDU37797.1 VOC family protein [Neobacillus piezotolerans]
MEKKLLRVGTMYLPVSDVEAATKWYTSKLGAQISYKDGDKAIANFANQSFFLVKAEEGQSANFRDSYGNERFSVTFEVDGLEALEAIQSDFLENGVTVGEIENRGHTGRNFVFRDPDGNAFDVWSELSPTFKEYLAHVK